jgi:DNA invertase Pin-like site-specific DNA recombinase
VFAEFETNLRKERQLEGIVDAKARGASGSAGRTAAGGIDRLLLEIK